MKYANKLLILFVIVILAVTNFTIISMAENSDSLASIQLFVSPDGNDSNSGTIEKPFATLDAARDAVRELKSSSPDLAGQITVYLRGGKYPMTSSFKLSTQDSGTKDLNIVYTAYNGEEVNFTGGPVLDGKEFKPVSNSKILKRLPKETASKVYELDLKSQGVEVLPDIKSKMQVFFNENSLVLARWPDVDYYKVPEVINTGAITRAYAPDKNPPDSPDYIPPEKQEKHGAIIRYDEERIDKWVNNKDILFDGFWAFLWADDILVMKTLDTKEKTIEFTKPHAYGVLQETAKFYAFNILEELDMPGEYYIDKDTKMMYVYPPSAIETAQVQLALMDKEFITMDNVSNVVISGIKFQTTKSRGITMNNCKDCLVYNCIFTSMSDGAITITGGTNCGVVSNTMYNIDKTVISIVAGDRQTLTPSGHYVENNIIHDFSVVKKTYTPAVWPDGVGIRVSNNKIYNAPHSAILFQGNDNIFEYNEIYDVLKESNDAGAIYSGRDFTWRGNVIKYNYIHDVVHEGSSLVSAVYPDDAMSSMTIFGNIFNNVTRIMHAGGGRDHIIKNNIMMNAPTTIAFDARAKDRTVEDLTDPKSTDTLTKRMLEVPIAGKIWSKKYPELAAMLTDANPGYPKGNIIENNALINSTDLKLDPLVTEYGKVSNNVILGSDSGVVIDKNNKVTIKDDSIIYKKIPGFEKIPTDRIGNYTEMLNSRMENVVALVVGNGNSLVKNTKKQIDASNFQVSPIISEGRTLVPVRFISESVGAKVDWNAETSEITLKSSDKEIKMKLGSKIMSINGTESTLDVPAQSISGRTLIPLRALVEALGKKVFWDERGLILISDIDNVMDKTNDAYQISEIIRKIKY